MICSKFVITIFISIGLFCIGLFLPTCFYKDQSQLNSVKVIADSRTQKVQNKDWRNVSLPFYIQAMAIDSDSIILVGEEGFIALDSFGKVKKYPKLKIKNEFVTNDGGLTRKVTASVKRFPMDEKSYPYVCEPEHIVSVFHRFYVFSNCENSMQFWQATPEIENTLLNITNFTNSNKFLDEPLYGPSGLSVSNGNAILSSYNEKGPALLTEDSKTNTLKVTWQGKAEDGGIVSICFVGEEGWMLLGKGKFLRSFNSGKSWEYLSNISSEILSSFIDMKFQSESIGYIIGKKGLILLTEDGGLTWKTQISETTTDLYNIAIDKNLLIACCSDKGLLVKNDKGLNKLEKPDGNIKDLLLFKQNLYVLIDGKLFFLPMEAR
jgi:Photosynthesis system II assembly factor YCF48